MSKVNMHTVNAVQLQLSVVGFSDEGRVTYKEMAYEYSNPLVDKQNSPLGNKVEYSGKRINGNKVLDGCVAIIFTVGRLALLLGH